MVDDLTYISTDDLPQFSNFDYSKEQSDVPVIDSDYDRKDVEQLLADEGSVLLKNVDETEAIEGVVVHMFNKITSLSEVGTALDPRQTRGVTQMYRANNEDALYLTENQFRTRFL